MSIYGEAAAISSAAVWSAATWLYSQFSHQFSALQLNIVKGVVASAMMLLVLPFMPQPEWQLSASHLWILGLSGVIGIAIGDSAYFAALKRIGANKTLLLESLAPPLSGVLALLALGASLSLQSWFGVLLTTAAVMYVIAEPHTGRIMSSSGIAFGVLASVCQATGVVISHYALVEGNIPPLIGALIRLSIGVGAVMLVVGRLESQPFCAIRRHLSQLNRSSLGWLLAAIFVGTFLALWLQQIALKNANPAIAQTLIATSPLFILVICACRGEPLTRRGVLGTLAALVGISLFFIR